MPDLLTPEAVENWMKSPLGIVIDSVTVTQLGRDYLTLWKRNEELKEHHKKFLQKVTRDLDELVQQVKRL